MMGMTDHYAADLLDAQATRIKELEDSIARRKEANRLIEESLTLLKSRATQITEENAKLKAKLEETEKEN